MDEQKNTTNNGVDNIVETPINEPVVEESAFEKAAPIAEPVVDETAFEQMANDIPIAPQPEVALNADGEIDIDPDIVQIVSEQTADEQSINNNANTQQSYAYAPPAFEHKRTIEPTAPIMPQIVRSEYKPIDTAGTSRGMKVFAIIVALMVLISASVTGGYFLGASKNGTTKVKVDLAEKPTPENALSVSKVYETANKSVVGIFVYNDSGIVSTASGVIYSKDGYVVTNDHIYADVASAKFKIYTYDGKSFSASYVAGDTRSDLAVLKIKDPVGLTPATFGNSDELAVGETVVAVGRPNGANQSSTASEGIVSATARRVSTTSSYTGRFIQTDSAINPGSSGGALYNLYGQVIGITSAKLVGSEYEGVGFAIPTTIMKNIVESLIEHGTVKGRAKLGISYQAVDELSAEIEKTPCGLRIAAIDESSDLYGKSVEAGDTITHVNGTEITDSNMVLDIIENSKPGDTLNLKVYSLKSEKSFDISVKLLEDTGSSSYTTKQSNTNSDSEQQYNSSEFNFPNGE